MWRNHGPGIVVVVAVLTAGLFTLGIHGAGAVTHAPCSYRYGGTPYVNWIDENVTDLAAGGQLSGCPKVVTITSESVRIVLELQHYRYDPTLGEPTWVTYATGEFRGSANRYIRFWNPPRAGGTIHATCLPEDSGLWRTHAWFYDGWAPYEGVSNVVDFKAGDSGVCGSYGGGD